MNSDCERTSEKKIKGTLIDSKTSLMGIDKK